MSELIFYYNPRSRAQTVHWMLEEVGQPYETVLLDYGAQMKSADYLAINPMGKVPAIVHHGRVVTEAAAICLYLADAFPQAGLAPPPEHRQAYYRWTLFAAGPVEQAMMDGYRKLVPDEQQQVMVGYGSWDRVISALETAVSATDFVAGDRFSAADVYFGAQLDWCTRFGIMEARAPFTAYLERIRARPAYQRSMGEAAA